MTPAEVAAAAASAGLSGSAQITAVAIAGAESGYDPASVGDQGTSFGLWQIHLPAHPQYTAAQMVDPLANAAAMAEISSGGTNWHPWSTYNNGAYLAHMPEAQAAVMSSGANAGVNAQLTVAHPGAGSRTGGTTVGTGITLWDVFVTPGGMGEAFVRIGETVAGGLIFAAGLVLITAALFRSVDQSQTGRAVKRTFVKPVQRGRAEAERKTFAAAKKKGAANQAAAKKRPRAMQTVEDRPVLERSDRETIKPSAEKARAAHARMARARSLVSPEEAGRAF